MQPKKSFLLPSGRVMSKAFGESGIENVVKWEVFPVSNKERIRLVFESAKPGGRHGVWLLTDGGLYVNGQMAESMDIWQDTAPEIVEIEVRTVNGALHLYNIWDMGEGRNSQSWTSGMQTNDVPLGRRYQCNDIGFESGFDDLVFRLERCPA